MHTARPKSVPAAPSARTALLLTLLCFACTSSRPVMNPPSGVRVVGAGADSTPDAAPTEGEEGNEPKEKWSVGQPPGPRKEIQIDTREGSWMSVDVSPDGREIVFDLLGDLYTLPLEGGEAKPLTEGVAWDMQPRYSPDGAWIAFTSDRGGGDNVWVLPRGGGEARQVTKETFELLNSPAWSRDGEYLVARKHFTSGRSLGSGEIWMYHRSGGKGVQLSKKPNEQKDVGEPAFGHDGRYVYFSQDTTPGNEFEYNKDPNGQIYEIKRIDLLEKRIEGFIGGAGGAVRPTPSPDGHYIAFVRRVGGQSVLYLQELASGAEWPVYRGLDRDLQETWAIHGVYPAMAWTPDATRLVFWAGGKIWRVDPRGGEREVPTEIPFHVRDTRTVTEPLRYPVEVAPDEFDVRVIRWPTLSPDGARMAFGALGKIYVRDQATGAVRRLTSQEDHVELNPVFSPDGQSIAYATWDDADLGTVRIADAVGGAGRIVSERPGHYVEPLFSPGGDALFVRRIGSDSTRSHRWARDRGLWKIGLGPQSSPRRVRRVGSGFHFGADPARLYAIEDGKDDARVLVSTDLDGHERREHLSVKMAMEMRVSPDGRWVAFTVGFRVYVIAFPASHFPIDVNPKDAGLPVAKVSSNAGYFLHWSPDASALHWMMGPEHFTRTLADSFAFLEGAPEKLPEPPATGVNVGFRVPSARPLGKLAIVGARMVTMKGDEVIEDAVIVVERNRIVAIGPRDNVPIPSDAHVIDAAGLTAIPGLIDVHSHGPHGADGLTPEVNWFHYATLAFGVTTLHDPSNDTYSIFGARELSEAGHITSPRIFSTGTILYGAKSDVKAQIDSLEDARGHLARLKAIGAFSVKSYNQPRRDQRQQVIAAGRELGMMVVPEGGSLFMHNMTMVVDGHTGVEHALPVARVYADVQQLWGATRVGFTPTLNVAYGGAWGENYWYQHGQVWAHERLLRFVPRQRVDSRARRGLHIGDGDWNHIRAAQVARSLQDGGVEVNLGSHGQREGLGAHWELRSFVQGGMTPHQALRVGTLHGARYLGLDGDIGSLEVGKLADIALIDGNPLERIEVAQEVRYVVVNGRIFDAASMDEVGARAAPRPKLFWELDRGARPGPAGPFETCVHIH